MSLDTATLDTTNPPHITGHLLLFRNSSWDKWGLSDVQIREAMKKVTAWFDDLAASGKLVGAQPLLEDTVVISGKGGRSVTDGPFAETKEAIGGYVLLSVETMEEAVAIAKTNPMHEYGLTTEVRSTASSCPKLYQLNREFAEAAV
jgi:hypothetical protein